MSEPSRAGWPSIPEQSWLVGSLDHRHLLRLAVGYSAVSWAVVCGARYVWSLNSAMRPKHPLWHIALQEIPVWFGWLLLVPLILRVCARFPFARGRWMASACVHTFTFAGFLFVCATVTTLGRWPLLGIEPEGFAALVAIYMAYGAPAYVPCYLLIVIGHHAMVYARQAARNEARETLLSGLLSRAQLHALQSQVQPHFLFNCLNGIAAMIGRDDDKAGQMVADLGALLRFAVDGSEQQSIALGEELRLLERYVALQRTRFEERLQVVVDAPPELRSLPVPPFLLQPLVENVVKHVVERRHETVRVAVVVRHQDDRLVVRVADNGPGWPASLREGCGIGNLRERLSALYGPAQKLVLGCAAEGGAEVVVELPANQAAVARGAN